MLTRVTEVLVAGAFLVRIWCQTVTRNTEGGSRSDYGYFSERPRAGR